ncbi:MAG: bifunctional tetrahydrofolate synthase/dihydrofolate synthase [Gammaproteobacteria bacterium]|nr:bifunctional tetrahydrofolate synthase/dihydrofolate synthase [Gammaproteobacteria bacterium]
MRFSRLSDWLSWQERLHPSAIELGLERVRRTLARLGWRPPTVPVITVAGTNGKGSTVALLTRILTEAGYRVGTFTSPHLIRYNERIAIAEKEVSDASLLTAFERIDSARGGDTLTFFEFNTIAALLIFETAGVDVLVLEVGMGGRLDAVNVVDPDVAVITSIAVDHREWLGQDVEAIGAEKAGILRAGRPAIFGSRDMPRSVGSVAAELGSQLQCLGRDFDWERADESWSFKHETSDMEGLPLPALPGEVQLDNAAAALACLACVRHRLPVARSAIERGLVTVALPGRFQRIECETEWILDVAHNPAAASVLGRSLRSLAARRPCVAVCGVLGDKDLDNIYRELADVLDVWVVAGLQGQRALDSNTLARRLRDLGARIDSACEDVPQACARALHLAGREGRVAVFGSFLTVGPALQWLREHCVTLR